MTLLLILAAALAEHAAFALRNARLEVDAVAAFHAAEAVLNWCVVARHTEQALDLGREQLGVRFDQLGAAAGATHGVWRRWWREGRSEGVFVPLMLKDAWPQSSYPPECLIERYASRDLGASGAALDALHATESNGQTNLRHVSIAAAHAFKTPIIYVITARGHGRSPAVRAWAQLWLLEVNGKIVRRQWRPITQVPPRAGHVAFRR